MNFLPLLFLVASSLAANSTLLSVDPSLYVTPSPCTALDQAFTALEAKRRQEEGRTKAEPPACRCFHESPSPAAELWIGCTGYSMPKIFDYLNAVNLTLAVSRVQIWDSLINIIPEHMFSKFRPRTLVLERLALALFRNNSLSPVAEGLRHLSLRHNIIKQFDPTIMAELKNLESLDVSNNKLSSLHSEWTRGLFSVTELSFANNDISNLHEGALNHLVNLRSLNLRGNKIQNITNATFKGLVHMERLDLSHNQISSIDWTAFTEMRNLKELNLGSNQINAVELRGFTKLTKLILNNNAITSLKDLNLRDLPALTSLSVDRNQITSIGQNDLSSLATSTALLTLSVASNNISEIHYRAFAHVSPLTSLSLQDNNLTSLSDSGSPWALPLGHLKNLFVSGNSIGILKEDDVPHSVERLAIDHNRLAKVEATAFNRLSLTHLYLNNNNLHHLYRGTFDSIDNSSLVAIDLSNNPWLCLCGEEWLGQWLEEHKQADIVNDKYTNGCLEGEPCTIGEIEESPSTWVTLVAGVLATVSLCILVAIAWLFVEDGKQRALPLHKEHKARGVNADRLRLINENEKEEGEKVPPAKERKVRFDGE